MDILIPQIMAAVFSFGGALLGATVGWFGLNKRIDADLRLAREKFNFDRNLLIHRRRFELAETLLADAYRFRDLMAYVRNSAPFGDEGKSRRQGPNESPDVQRLKNAYFVPVERLQRESDFVTAFFAKGPTAQAHFGDVAGEALKLFEFAANSVRGASKTLIELLDHPLDSTDLEFTEQLRGDLWVGYSPLRNSKEDQIAADIDKAVMLIEDVCKSVLQWEGAQFGLERFCTSV